MKISTSLLYQRGVNAIDMQQSNLSQTQEQLATGERLRSPADDPFASTRINTLDDQQSRLDQYVRNAGFATTRLELEESSITAAVNALQGLRELAVQMANDTYSSEDRVAASFEAFQLTDSLLQVANMVDEDGEYIFSGDKTSTQAYVTDGNGNFTYQGDQGQRYVQVGPSRTVPTGDSGYDVFENIKVTGSYTTGNLSSLDFTTETLSFDVDGQTVAVSATDYSGDLQGLVDELQTTLDGLTVGGQSAAGKYTVVVVDSNSFKIESNVPGGDPNPFKASVTNFVTTITGADNGSQIDASTSNVMEVAYRFANTLKGGSRDETALESIDAAMQQLLGKRSTIGGRINTIDSEISANEVVSLSIDKNRSELKDLDYAEAISRFQQQLAGLQAAQQSFVQIQGLSLFNYI